MASLLTEGPFNSIPVKLELPSSEESVMFLIRLKSSTAVGEGRQVNPGGGGSVTVPIAVIIDGPTLVISSCSIVFCDTVIFASGLV